MGMVLTSFIHKFHNGNPCDKIKAYTYTYNIIFDDISRSQAMHSRSYKETFKPT